MCAVCVMTGLYASYRLNMRAAMLEKLCLMFDIVENEIRYLGRPASEIVASLCARTELSGLTFLADCESGMLRGEDFRASWERSLSETKNVRFFRSGDVGVISSFGSLLGMSDAEGQTANCRMHRELALARLAQARLSRDRYSAVFSGLGVLAGIGAIIVLI